jgi:hypothetical protein
VTFLRQIALLLPSAFLLGVLLFLLTHGRGDPGFGAYPFLEEWSPASASWSPEARFLAQSSLFFVPVYAVTLLFVLAVTLAEKALFGHRAAPHPLSAYRRSFGALFSVLFLLASGVLVLWADRLASQHAPGAVLAPLIVALAPFAAGVAALAPAAALAAPLAALRKAGGA